jgi:hypothetical protein
MNRNNLLRQLHFRNHNSNNLYVDEPIDNNLEDKCMYVSSRGILKSCNIRSVTPISSITKLINYNQSNFSMINEKEIIYVCSTAISDFINKINEINEIKNKFILITGDSDFTLTDNDFSSLIENEKIIHWFSQNYIGNHQKITQIPIGLDYHTLAKSNHEWGEMIGAEEQEKILIEIKNNSMPFWERKKIGYSNFHFHLTGLYCNDRKEAINDINKDLIFYEPIKVKRIDSWKNQSEYAFVVSPHGNGLDCHRTWEALCLGCIVIVRKSKLDSLYEDLPVLIVNDWKDISNDLLNKTIEEFIEKEKNGKFNYDKLTLKYWMDKIKRKMY